ncbi:MAG: hypothetical protein MUE88_10835 [Flavobacteriales bacterium]|jgi:hypothetical protein|nr:hypothetical protein [Flavobacteriales bacterium]
MEAQEPQYGVFIIESMDMENERQGKLDGQALKTILDLCDIPNDYYYIRTKLELEHVMDEFVASNFQFLHFSCHGNEKELSLTLETLSYEEFEEIIGECMWHRRLFLSACRVARLELAERFIPKHHAYSVIGTPEDIAYDKAAIVWSTFYHLMYEDDQVQMFQRNLLPVLTQVSEVYKVSLNYFSIIQDAHPQSLDHLREINLVSGRSTLDTTRKTPYRNRHRDANGARIPFLVD